MTFSSQKNTSDDELSAQASSTSTLSSQREQARLLDKMADCDVDGDLEDFHDLDDEVETFPKGQSTFTQTLLNTLGDLIGTGLLATPIAIAYAGWIFGPLFLILVGAMTNMTLKILVKIMDRDQRLRNYTDAVSYGLGPRSERYIKSLFLLEVSVWTIATVVLFSDSLEAVWPIFTSDQWKLVGLLVILPTIFLPLRLLSYSSAVGIISTYTLVGILLVSGIATKHSPGALRDPAPTDLLPAHGFTKLAMVFGLIMSGFGGHALVPTLMRDMKDPSKAGRVIDLSYGLAMIIYLIVGIAGYIMYGRYVSDEISKDLALTPGFSPLMNKVAVWMVAINPLTKIAMGLKPLADVMNNIFHIQPTRLITPIPVPASSPIAPGTPIERHADEYTPLTFPFDEFTRPSYTGIIDEQATLQAHATRWQRREKWKHAARQVVLIMLAIASVFAALLFPSFEFVLALLGSGFAFVTCCVIPYAAGLKVLGWNWPDAVGLVFSALIALVGTVAACINH